MENIMEKIKNLKLKNKNKKEIPIFFASDDNYIPFLEVALKSLIKNASTRYNYSINILNTGIKEENQIIIKSLERKNVNIHFRDISSAISDIKNNFKNIYHYSLATYYRLFIESLFPQYNKVVYLDCDIVVLGDISKLYNVNLGNNLVAAVPDQIVSITPMFQDYTKVALGIDYRKYFSAGILLMNLTEFRKEKIQDKFTYLLSKYNFDTVAPDQDYLNVLCKNRVKYLPNGWNKQALPVSLEGDLHIMHYALYKKPWQYDDVLEQRYFWEYAKDCLSYDKILEIKADFTDVKREQKERANAEIIVHAQTIINSDTTFYKTLYGEEKSQYLLDEISLFSLSTEDKVEI